MTKQECQEWKEKVDTYLQEKGIGAWFSEQDSRGNYTLTHMVSSIRVYELIENEFGFYCEPSSPGENYLAFDY